MMYSLENVAVRGYVTIMSAFCKTFNEKLPSKDYGVAGSQGHRVTAAQEVESMRQL